jgi:DNA-binding GntR family transcriptional regulator
MVSSANQGRRSKSDVSSSPDWLAGVLRSAILRGEFAPGQRLIEAELAEQLEASRANVRAALLTLTNEGLVEHSRYRGARVHSTSLAQAVEIAEVRLVLEALVAGRAAERVTPEEVRELRGLVHDLESAIEAADLLSFAERTNRLQHRVALASRQGAALLELARLYAQMARHEFRSLTVPGRAVASLRELAALVEAIADHDRGKAEAASRDHFSHLIEAMTSAATARDGAPARGVRIQ